MNIIFGAVNVMGMNCWVAAAAIVAIFGGAYCVFDRMEREQSK